ncbi:MAG: pantetheine-phosphate adenylyltransferase [Anaerolineales bacterium]|jgi:pantetheine-phosphate adenylyltransferase
MVRALFPGTFDPIHFGHINIAERAARLFDELIIAVYDKPLKSLLFPPEERISLVKDTFQGHPKIKVIGYSGLTVQLCQKINAQVVVRGLRVFSDFEFEFRMALANHRLAPDIESIALITDEEHTFLSSTTVREIAMLGGDVSSMVPANVMKALMQRVSQLDDQQKPANALRD